MSNGPDEYGTSPWANPASGYPGANQSGASGYPDPGQNGYPEPAGYPEPGTNSYPEPGTNSYPPAAEPYAQPGAYDAYPTATSGYPATTGYPGASGYQASGYPAVPYANAYTYAPEHPYGMASMITGIASLALTLLCGFGVLGGPVALGLAIAGRNQMKQFPDRWSPTGSLTAGLVLGAITTGLLALSLVVAVVYWIAAAATMGR